MSKKQQRKTASKSKKESMRKTIVLAMNLGMMEAGQGRRILETMPRDRSESKTPLGRPRLTKKKKLLD